MKHTKEPWSLPHFANDAINCDCGLIFGSNEPEISCIGEIFRSKDDSIFESEYPQSEEAKENAKRIIACVNACQGISNEALDAGILDDAIALLLNAGKDVGVTWENGKPYYDGVKVEVD